MQQHNNFTVIANETVFQLGVVNLAEAAIVKTSENSYHLIHKNQSVVATILEFSKTAKTCKVLIEGAVFNVVIKDELDQMLETMGFGSALQHQLLQLKAPMPGLVLEINVTEGQHVTAGEKVLVLEAMKMENSLQLPAAAIIKKVLVKKGQAVEKGQLLLELLPPVVET